MVSSTRQEASCSSSNLSTQPTQMKSRANQDLDPGRYKVVDLFRKARERRYKIIKLKRSKRGSVMGIKGGGPGRSGRGSRRGGMVNGPWNFGRPKCFCQYCKASRAKNTKFTTCCLDGRVELPWLKHPPNLLIDLLDYRRKAEGAYFRRNIRVFNASLCFTSMGGHIDKQINKKGGPYAFRLNGQNYHLLGSLTPSDGSLPKFAQLFIHDTDNEIPNRMSIIRSKKKREELHKKLLTSLNQCFSYNCQYINLLYQSFSSNSQYIFNRTSGGF